MPIDRSGAPPLSNYVQFGADGYIRNGSAWSQIQNASVRDGSAWKQVVKSWVKDGNQWKLWFDPMWALSCYNDSGQSGNNGTRAFYLPNRSGTIYCSVWGAGGFTNYTNEGERTGRGGYSQLTATVGGSSNLQPGTLLHIVVGQHGLVSNSGSGSDGSGSGSWTFGGGGSHLSGSGPGGGCSGIFVSSSTLTPGSKAWPLYGNCTLTGFPGGSPNPAAMFGSALVVAGGGGGVDRWAITKKNAFGGDGGGIYGSAGSANSCVGSGGSQFQGGLGACDSSRSGRCWNGGPQKRENDNFWAGRMGGGGLFGGGSGERASGGGSGYARTNGGGWSGLISSFTSNNRSGAYFDTNLGHPGGFNAGYQNTHGYVHIRNFPFGPLPS